MIKEISEKVQKSLWNHFYEIPACGRQVCNQRAKSIFSELSQILIDIPNRLDLNTGMT